MVSPMGIILPIFIIAVSTVKYLDRFLQDLIAGGD